MTPRPRAFSPGPTSITVFLAEGDPEGLLVVSMRNWTGLALVVSRSQQEKLLGRDEASRPGLYALIGKGENEEPRLYVGEANNIRTRLTRRDHKAREFWTRVIAFVSTDESLNKASMGHLEARLIRIALDAKQWEVENETSPTEPPLSEPERAAAEEFLSRMLLIYPLLGVDAFDVAGEEVDRLDGVHTYRLNERGAEARGFEEGTGFTVLQGSLARGSTVPSVSERTEILRESLLSRGVLQPLGTHLEFTQNFRFASPSQASSVLVGGASNGRRAWKSERTGRSLKQEQEIGS